jgi:hypothetical protein
MESNRLDRDAAAAQLATLQADRASLADRVVPPWWYDVSLGSLLGCFLASYAFQSKWVTLSATLVLVVGLNVLVSAYRRITGVWLNIDARGMALFCAVYLPVLIGAFVLAEGFDQYWVMVPAGVILGVATTLVGRRWNRALAAELRGQR